MPERTASSGSAAVLHEGAPPNAERRLTCETDRALIHAEPGMARALMASSTEVLANLVHDVRVINPLCHFFQQPVVPDIVKVGSQVKVEDARLPLDNCLGYSLDRVMCCPLGPISSRKGR
jgi:hypothetical protein